MLPIVLAQDGEQENESSGLSLPKWLPIKHEPVDNPKYGRGDDDA